jgi:SPP1 gp7 family putative phage head morphogenesis protein
MNANEQKLRLPNIKITDATHTASLRKSYQMRLNGLFIKFDNELKPGLARMMDRNIEYVKIKKGFIREFSDKLNTISDVTIYAGAPKIIDEHITRSYRSGKERAANNPRLKDTIRIDPKLSMLDMGAIEDLKTRNLGLVTKLTEDMKIDLLRIMTDGMQQGQGTAEISRNISGGIEDISRKRAETIARTEIAYSYNTAISDSYKKIGIDKWQWLAALGYTCCDECIANHGEIFDWNDPRPPLHPNCMCSIYPILPGDEE